MAIRRWRRLLVAAAVGVLLAGCGADAPGIPVHLLRESRPIGVGARFHPPVRGPVVGACRGRLGPRIAAHIEVFAANRVVVLPAGIGVRSAHIGPLGRVARARCFGAIVTLDPTGVVLARPHERLTVADVFRSWGLPLSVSRVGSFRADAAGRVRVFVGGRRWRGSLGGVRLFRHGEIVLEIGPTVAPHASFAFPPGS